MSIIHGRKLIDSFGRVVVSLRISVTDRCNFRCLYCMPEDPVFMPREEVLTFEEIERFVRICAGLGIKEIRLTGGEPTVRKDLPVLVRMIAQVPGIEDIAMTTNGFFLKEQAAQLKEAGLHRLNVSLDTLDEHKFHRITRRDAFRKVMEGLDEAERVGFSPIKINAVAMRDFTEDELIAFAALARSKPYQIRYIEFMPLDADNIWERSKVLPAREILERINSVYPLEPVRKNGNEPATVYKFKDGKGEIGVIPTVTEPFCSTCDRIRITADGKLRTCLFSVVETDIKSAMRGGSSDEEISALIVDAVKNKEPGHFINTDHFVKPARNMSMIGG